MYGNVWYTDQYIFSSYKLSLGSRMNPYFAIAAIYNYKSVIFFQVPPPSIDFVLPSPTIGMPCLTVVDPPWQPHFKSKVEEVTINQDESVNINFLTFVQ